MKIQRFNEEIESSKKYYFCVITCYDDLYHSGIFETEEDMNNWILNIVNESLSNESLPPEEDGETIVESEEGGIIFVDIAAAKNWYCDDAYSIICSTSTILSNIDAKYGVEIVRQANKYNI
jgi:hypothetical protein